MLIELADTFMENLREFSVDEMWDTFERSIRSIMDACIPHKMTSASSLQERNMSLITSVSQLKIIQSAFGRLLNISKKTTLV